MHERQGKALTNFSQALPPEGSDLAKQILKDPYQFNFLTLASSYKERELEHGLLIHLRDLLLELGRGFALLSLAARSARSGRSDFLSRPALLSCSAALLFCDRTQGWTVQT
jgi:predicted nuclease of restriction endonuclease-like (RecB) superfamily